MICRRAIPLLLLASLCTFSAAEDFRALRYFRFRGKILDHTRLISWTPDRSKVTLQSGMKIAEVALQDFSAEDQAFVNRAADAADRAGKPPLLETDPVFKQPAPADRSSIPLLNQGDYGQKASDCVPSSFCNFLLWWDQQGVLPIGKRGDFADKAEWIHTRMARFCRTSNNGGTSYDEAVVGFSKYFGKEVPDQLVFATKVDYDIRPENIARYTTGYNATLLGLTTAYGNKKSGHMVALISATPAGEVVFHTWGHKMKGRIVVLEKKDEEFGSFYGENRKGVNATVYEIKIEPDEKFEDWVRQTRFLLDPEQWDSIVIVKPYVFAKPGAVSKVPDDPLMARD